MLRSRALGLEGFGPSGHKPSEALALEPRKRANMGHEPGETQSPQP